MIVQKYVQETRLLDYSHPMIQQLVKKRRWKEKETFYQVSEIYRFVRDEIKFGFNVDDRIRASKVLKDGYGQCNTKGILLMALLRAVGIPCRMHGFTVDKSLQKGAITGTIYRLTPQKIVHSWVEVWFEGVWYQLEGFIIDILYLKRLQNKFSNCSQYFCGYGVATDQFKNPPIEWNKNHTYIQKAGIIDDFGVFNDPDDFLQQYTQQLSIIKKWMYRHVVRKQMNRKISKIRAGLT